MYAETRLCVGFPDCMRLHWLFPKVWNKARFCWCSEVGFSRTQQPDYQQNQENTSYYLPFHFFNWLTVCYNIDFKILLIIQDSSDYTAWQNQICLKKKLFLLKDYFQMSFNLGHLF